MAMRLSVICAWLSLLTLAATLSGALVRGESYAKLIISETVPRERSFFRWLIFGDSVCTTPATTKTEPQESTMLDSPYLTLALKLTLMAILCYTL
ncbi:uncharacterized protein LOC126579018 [Anopheles aquasalis]|uniref:uncharacterized protein LOC126579018 n=1 Tax=Anopheles aquasalis TaxID=42839 RepID=UPI00215A621D|nr:uncharacterized protein LOC126579018 [Anopheles aquasalis]